MDLFGNEFNYYQDMEKLKKLNKSVLYRKFEKILKGHRIAIADPIWA
jgi:hypothetical protein